MAEASHVGQSKDKQLIATLLRSRLFKDYETVFTKATGLPLTLQPVEFWQLAHHGKKHENPFCALLAERPATLAVCLQAHQNMIDHTGLLPHTVTCPFGLTETAIPINLGSRVMGYLRIGQVLRHTPARSDESKLGQELNRHGVPFTPELRKAWSKTPPFFLTGTTRSCDCSRFLASNSPVWQTNWSLNRKTSSRRLCKRRASTSINIKPRNYHLRMWPRPLARACFISAKFFTKLPAYRSPITLLACAWKTRARNC